MAQEMLRLLQDDHHTVYTGLALLSVPEGREVTGHERTEVYFGPLTSEEIAAYVDSGEPDGKAGAYGVQGLGAVMVKRIEGCYFNVVGLPLYRLRKMLEDFGYNVFYNF